MDRQAPVKKLIGLADCNNFFVSCERVFRPDLEGKPVVVLSSNDGCVISRSNEAKALNIPMGIPWFKVKDAMRRQGVVVFSGNMELYGDFSSRVMSVLRRFSDRVEPYSIDESFFNLAIAAIDDPLQYCRDIRATILKNCGIPVSIGISTTKTLCKVASELAKERSKKDPLSDGVQSLMPEETEDVFLHLPLEDVWGIGRKSAQRLYSVGIRTVPQLLREDEKRIRRILSIRGVLTVRELKGIPCLSLEEAAPPPQSLQVSRSFGQKLTRYDDIAAAVVKHAVEGAFRLRKQRLCAGAVGCILQTSRFAGTPCFRSAELPFDAPTSRDGDVISGALKCLKEIFLPGLHYAKTGIYLNRLVSSRCRQMNLFEAGGDGERQDRLMCAIDSINRTFGRTAIEPAMLQCTEASEPQCRHRSPWNGWSVTARIAEERRGNF
ncbi:MAG: Y-family DNA polymerase [Pyramidobacter sp.]|jgi:DNA polymerase V